PAISKHRITEHARDVLSISDVAGKPDGRAAVAYPRARNSDAFAVLCDCFAGSSARCRLVHVNADDVRAFFNKPVSSGFPNSASCADDCDDLPVKLTLRRQPSELG